MDPDIKRYSGVRGSLSSAFASSKKDGILNIKAFLNIIKSIVMKINTSKFVISNTDIKKCPEPDMPEYAFIGRSNVGKSSLINMLCNHKGLAKISGRPGKTQLINHFIINDNWHR